MNSPWQIMTRGDWLVTVLLLGIALLGIGWLAATPPGSRVEATCGGQTCFVADLEQPQEVDLAGPLGMTHLVIDGQGARITASPCPLQICMTMGPARHTGDLLACVPNRILVSIEHAEDETPYDLLSR
ncbi:MAG: NusG domain II-containing protein [Desulfuromonadales bacterium]|jgi:hypothetical protein